MPRKPQAIPPSDRLASSLSFLRPLVRADQRPAEALRRQVNGCIKIPMPFLENHAPCMDEIRVDGAALVNASARAVYIPETDDHMPRPQAKASE